MTELRPLDVDDAAWDQFVAGQPNGHLLQTSRWGRFKAETGWEALRLAVGAGAEIAAGALVLLRRLPLGQRLAYVPKGPVGVWSEPAVGAALFSHMHQTVRRRGAFLLKVEPEERDSASPETSEVSKTSEVCAELSTTSEVYADGVGALLSAGFQPSAQTVQPRSTIWIDLDGSADDLRARMKPKTRYNIGLAGRKGVVVRRGTPADLPAFGQLMDETGRRDGFAVHGPAYYERAYRAFADVGACTLLLATFEEQLLAGLMAFAWGKAAWYMYGASSNAERQRMPNHALQWEAMSWAQQKGCRWYDLWGIPDEVGQAPAQYEETVTDRHDGLWGVYRFKQGFGGQVVRYAGAFDFVYSPARFRLYRWALRLRRSAALG